MATQMKAAGVLMGGGEPLSKVLPKDVYEMAEAEVKRINPALSLQPFETMTELPFLFDDDTVSVWTIHCASWNVSRL